MLIGSASSSVAKYLRLADWAFTTENVREYERLRQELPLVDWIFAFEHWRKDESWQQGL